MDYDTLSSSNYFHFLSHFYELLEFGHLSHLIFMNYSNLGTCQKMKYFHKITQKSFELPRCRYCVSLVASTCKQNITLITLHTTLIPTRKLNGNTRVHTVLYLDSFGQEMPSLVLVKGQYSTRVIHFGYSLSYFRHAPLV
jgi:hypothetical protein